VGGSCREVDHGSGSVLGTCCPPPHIMSLHYSPIYFLANTTKAHFSQDMFQKEDAVPITTHLLPFPRSGPRASTDGL
jgi:hypothetical protein